MVAIIHSRRDQWLMRRRELITASDVGAVLGCDPFRRPGDVFADKLGLGESSESDAMRWGRWMEPAIADAYMHETQRVVLGGDPYELTIHPDLPWLGATLDRMVAATLDGALPAPVGSTGDGVLELKATGASDDWAAEPPLRFQLQLTIQMACTRRQWGSLAAFVSMRRPVLWADRIFDDELFGMIAPKLEEFHARVKRKDPPNDADWHSYASIRRIWPVDNGAMIPLDADAMALTRLWLDAKDKESLWKRNKEGLETELRLKMGAAKVGLLPDGTSLTLGTTQAVPVRAHVREPYRVLRHFVPKGRTQ